MKELNKYVSQAKKKGALNAVIIKSSDIVLDPRTILKCQFGCTGWCHNWTCPSAPKSLSVWEYERIIKKYKKGMIIHTRDKKKSQKIAYEIERQAYIDGHYFSFSMSDCALCKKCSYPKECRFPKKARPAMQGVGIDVFSTVRKLGLPIKTLKNESETPDWYSLVLFY